MSLLAAGAHGEAAADTAPHCPSNRPTPAKLPGHARIADQCLLERHEAYVLQAETERARMATTIQKLEASNARLEEENARIIEDNNALFGRIECLNTAVAAGDAQISHLSSALSSAQMEIHTLQFLTAKTQALEQQLEMLEAENAILNETVAKTKEEERALRTKWRDGQHRISELLDQVEIIEQTAREERARHEEVMQGLLQQDTAPKKEQSPRRDGTVVGNFVKEILQDNANMQMTMVDLQELLTQSRREMDSMREQLNDVQQSVEASRPSLNVELDNRTEKPQPKPLHVHHHYHGPRHQSARRPGVRPLRKVSTYSGRNTPSQSDADSIYDRGFHSRQSSSTSTSSNLPSPRNIRRKSFLSTGARTVSSGPGSPGSTYCPSTIFEQTYDDYTEYSRPTSPESNGLWSPTLEPTYPKDSYSDPSFAPLSLPSRLHGFPSTMGRADRDKAPKNLQDTTEHLTEDAIPIPAGRMSPIPSETEASQSESPESRRTPLRRTASHTSLISISGMDIHSTFPERSSLHTNRRPPPFVLQGSSAVAPITGTTSTFGPVVTTASVQAHADKTRQGSTGSWKYLRSNLEAVPENRSKEKYAPLSDTFGRGVSKWFAGRWTSGSGSANTAEAKAESPGLAGKRTFSDSASIKSASSQTSGSKKEDVSQLRAVSTGDIGAVMTEPLDSDALKECLDESIRRSLEGREEHT